MGARSALLIAVHQRLAEARHGEKEAIIAEACATLQCSVATLYRLLKAAGYPAKRRQRSDLGKSRMPLDELKLVSAVLLHSRRENRKQLTSVQDALDILEASGQLSVRLSAGRVLQLLRENHLHPAQLERPTPAIGMRSLHPNHVWQIDASTCVLYYVRSGHLAVMDADQFYRNKPENFAKAAPDLCTRYAVTDHTSGAFKARYYVGGESAANLIDFFIWSMSLQANGPMHGVPSLVMLDPGSANKGNLFRNLCSRLGVEIIINKVGNARAKGSVERTHDLIERHFEGRFRFFSVEELTLDRINEMCQEWTAAFCSDRQHTRHGESRYAAWSRISSEQLRASPPEAQLRELVTHEPATRTVSNTMTISYARKGTPSRTYDVSGVPGVCVGGRVIVQLNPFRSPAIDVRAEGRRYATSPWQTLHPIEKDANGFRLDAPIIGAQIQQAAHTPTDVRRNEITRLAYTRPGARPPTIEEANNARKRHVRAFDGLIDGMADVRERKPPTHAAIRSRLHGAATELSGALGRMTVAEACRRIKHAMGTHYEPRTYGRLLQRFPQGLTPAEVEREIEALQPRDEDTPVARSVGGGR